MLDRRDHRVRSAGLIDVGKTAWDQLPDEAFALSAPERVASAAAAASPKGAGHGPDRCGALKGRSACRTSIIRPETP